MHQAAQEHKDMENLVESKGLGQIGLFDHIDHPANGIKDSPCRQQRQRPSPHGEKARQVNEQGPPHQEIDAGVKPPGSLEPKTFDHNANDGKAFTKILDEMRSAGYKLYPNLYKFETYGVPQARHRIIIVGIRNDIDVEFKVPSNAPYAQVDNTCRTAIEVPPIPENAPNNDLTKQSPTVIERLSYIQPGQNAFTADLPEHLKLNISGAKISQIYKRLDPEKPAYTVTGSGGGGTHIYHWDEPRALTNRERARLQTFPDDFVFEGTKESVRKQIGMAVPCMGAKIIFEAILKSFAGIPYESIPANIEE